MIELLVKMYRESPLKAGYGERSEVYNDTHMNVGARLMEAFETILLTA
jgi:hypothetical protein